MTEYRPRGVYVGEGGEHARAHQPDDRLGRPPVPPWPLPRQQLEQDRPEGEGVRGPRRVGVIAVVLSMTKASDHLGGEIL